MTRVWTGVALLVLLSGCGSVDDPLPPTPPTSTPGGPVRGRYVFRLEPHASCRSPRPSYSFRVEATSQDGRRPGVRAVLEGASLSSIDAPMLEMELLYVSPNLQGSVATMPGLWGPGVLSLEGTYVWIEGIAVGAVATESGATVGEVQQGTLAADLSFGAHVADNDGLGTCVSTAHRWSLKLQ